MLRYWRLLTLVSFFLQIFHCLSCATAAATASPLVSFDQGVCPAISHHLVAFKPASDHAPLAVAVVTHGFNLRPDRLSSIIQLLTDHHVYVLRLTLSGHENGGEKLAEVTREKYLYDMYCATVTATKLANQYKVPLIFVGQSLGTLVNTDFVNQTTAPYYAKRVFIVPAISLNWYTSLIKVFKLLPFDVPSFSHKDYRVSKSVPYAAYSTLFTSYDAILPLNKINVATPTLIFAARDDELVSYNGLSAMMKNQHLGLWQLVEINNSASTLTPHYNHCALDPTSMGEEQWHTFTEQILAFLGVY